VPEEAAVVIALRALGWLALDADRLGQFLAASGAGAGDLRARAADPEFLAAILDYLMSEEAWVLDFCTTEGLPPDTPHRARAALPGGDVPHWT
jgi:hypothetical protein